MHAKGLIVAAALSLVATGALAQNVNIRGTIAAHDGKTIAVKTNDGRNLKIALPADVRISATAPFAMADIKPGMKLGVTTVRGPNGAVMALEIHPLSATTRVGLSPYDLAPESTMTNAIVEGTAASANGHELTLNYESGTVKALVTPSTRMGRSIPGSRDDLKPGEAILVVASRDGDAYTAVRLQVGKNGVKPPQ